ncbi:MAG: alpha/beta fold hydrolase [Haliscomenobacter sp.]|uniref:alpha/beta hydrolase n=1 Tax=Haliscomenobacter sp. TaxID=2717303 RepID=UPI0029B73E32|nr:alpha/beta fold hydrolase [Haliscomenobacter sp.]MDX2068933.1 alpha/beta fold hydrolase [Haliscomenobacter sp.]
MLLSPFFWANILFWPAVIYGGLCLFFYFFQDYFFFRPEMLPKNFEYRYPFPFTEHTFEMEDGGVINALQFKVPNSQGVVFYLKGNSRSLKGWGKFAKDFVSKGYDFFMIDYRGFGKSKGRRTESILLNDAQTVYKWLSKEYPEHQIIIYGRSLGSGIGARLASWNDPRMLILDSPYFSFYHQIRQYGWWLPLRYLLRYHLRSDQFIKKVTCPIYIIHGNKDRLISYAQGKRLHEISADRSTLITIEGGGHNNLPNFPEYHEHLYDILNEQEALVMYTK